MKNKLTLKLLFATLIVFNWGCDPKTPKEDESDTKEDVEVEESYSYIVNVSLDDTKKNAPDLQSFAHAAIGSDWLLFSGRQNTEDSIGGLHDMTGSSNYANTSFIPKSFNQDIIVYNLEKDEVWTLNAKTFIDKLKAQLPDMFSPISTMNLYNAFVNSNPLATQDENGFIYSVGGYGSIGNKDDYASYTTFGQVTRIHVPTMIKLVKGGTLDDSEWKKIFRYGNNDKLTATGAELFIIDDTYYLAGGHNYGTSANFFHGQKYLDAVYPFTLDISDESLLMTVNIGTPISDVDDPADTTSDATSKFRRRDGPVIPSVFKNGKGGLTEGFTFYGGVFKPGSDTNLYAWNTAIYVHPTGATKYEIDSDYNQKDYNVYACASFAGYDTDKDKVHTFLLGGIGDGKRAVHSRLSSFTNTAVHIQMDLSGATPTSSMAVVDDVYGTGGVPFYGAESILDVNDDLPRAAVKDGVSEVIDLNAAFKGKTEIEIGYIHGGIEAFKADPGTYGQGNSAASNKVWKVTLSKIPFVK